jgi:glycosyltransferase involved in cell wall biosynthesis
MDPQRRDHVLAREHAAEGEAEYDGDQSARQQQAQRRHAFAQEETGERDDGALRQNYRDCSLVVMPSAFALRSDGSAQGEGFGITYLEAALAARASIAADQGGQTDLILHGQTGWLLPPSPEALADLLRRLQEDPEQVRLCGERALAHASRHFSPERQRRLLAELVAPWLGSGSPGPRP